MRFEHWHYSRRMPSGKLVKLGVWEEGTFVGVVIYGRGSNNHLAQSFGLQQSDVAELVRVALRHHTTPVSRLLSIAQKELRTLSPGLRIVASYADPVQNHHGGIYQGAGWVYLGTSMPQSEISIHGEQLHKRSVSAKYGTVQIAWLRQYVDSHAMRVDTIPKHKYAIALDKSLQPMLNAMSQPYPKRPKDSSELSGQPAGRGRGSTDPDAPTTEV